MFCPKCGVSVRSTDKFCQSCGAELPRLVGIPPVTNSSISILEPPYAAFTLWFLAFLLLSSAAALLTALALAANNRGTVTPGITCLLIAILCCVNSWRSWRRIVNSEAPSDPQTGRAHKKIRRAAIVFAVLFLCVASGFGTVLGKYRTRLAALEADLNQVDILGQKISSLRTEHKYIEDYISMYEEMEPDVRRMTAAVQRAQQELHWYDDTYPANHKTTQESLKSYAIAAQRMDLLQQQIAMAKRLDKTDPGQRLNIWRSEMVPLLDKESLLDSVGSK